MKEVERKIAKVIIKEMLIENPFRTIKDYANRFEVSKTTYRRNIRPLVKEVSEEILEEMMN